MESKTETAANKLFDASALLRMCENRPLQPEDWVKVSRVVRHALDEVRTQLCLRCVYGAEALAQMSPKGKQ